jgi:hypothetical protein
MYRIVYDRIALPITITGFTVFAPKGAPNRQRYGVWIKVSLLGIKWNTLASDMHSYVESFLAPMIRPD